MKTKATVTGLGSLLAALFLVLVLVTPALALAPIINNQTLTIPENSAVGAATSPAEVFAFDPDNHYPLTYDILSGDGMGVFDSGVNNGAVTVAAGASLDYETKNVYTLNVRVTDQQPLSDTAVITINILDESDQPPNMNNQSFNVAENTANGATVGTIAFTDGDVSDSHTFTINSGNGIGGGAFQIDGNGKITVKDNSQLNYEVTTTFVLNVTIEDEAGADDTADITINVTNQNEKPNVSDQSFTISEAAPNNSDVGTVIATDPENGALTYSRTGTTAFNINPTTGVVTVADNSQLDYEDDPSMTFVVTVTDPGGQTDTATITVNLDDVNDVPFVEGAGIADIIANEGVTARTVNLWAAFGDDETPDNQMSFLVHANDNPGMFTSTQVNNTTGVLTLNFAAGAAGVANITIRAFDANDQFASDTFKVDINDTPVPVDYPNITVNEDAPNSNVNLYDGFDDAEQPSSELIYQVVGNTNPGLFSSVTIALPNLVLDYAPDAIGQSTITIKATDGGGLFAQTSFNVKVNAVNDPPTTSDIPNVTVAEDAPNTVIELFKHFDDKEEDAKDLEYEVTDTTGDDLFESVTISEAADTLTLDYKENTSGTATLTVRATDHGVPGVPNSSQFVETDFTVTVGGVNDVPVVSDFAKNINEDVPVQFTLNDFASHFEDADGQDLANVRILTLPGDGTLKLNNTNVIANQVIPAAELGNLSFVPALNWDQGSTSFDWNASDGTAYAVEPATVTINVNAQNDPPTVEPIEKVGTEGINITFSALDFTGNFNDIDGQTLQMVKIVSLPAHGQLRRGNANVGINDQINVGQLNDLRYVPEAFWFGEDSFNWTGSDGTLYATPAKVTLIVNPKNDPPALDLNGSGNGTGFNATFVAGGAPVKIAGQQLSITDIDSETMQSATIIIVNRKHGSQERLDADVSGTNITKDFSAGSGVLFLTGPDTKANFEKVLKTVTYQIAPEVANPDTNTVRDVSFRVNDGELNSNDAISKVRVIYPRIEITVTPPFQTVAKGTTAVFTINVKNIGDVDLENITVTSEVVPDCDRTFESLAAGQSLPAFACIVSDVDKRIDNEVIITATDAEVGSTVTAEDEAVVRVLQDIIIDISPDPAVGDTLLKGQNAVFNVTVINPSEADLQSVQVQAFIDYDLAVEIAAPATPIPAPACDQAIGNLAAGKEKKYTCTITNVQASFQIEVRATGLIDGAIETSDFDLDEIGVLDLTLEASSLPFTIPAGQPTTVEFSLTLNNVSNVPLTLTSLNSSLHGNLLNAGNNTITNNTCPALALVIPAGEVRFCSYEVLLVLEPPAITNMITAIVENDSDKQLTVVDEALVSVGEFSVLEVSLGADPASLLAPGGDVNLTVQVTNNTSTDLTLDTLNDSLVGNLDGKGTCELPTTLAGNGSYSCTYTVTISGQQAGNVVTHTVTAMADSEEASDSVAIPITSASQVTLRLPVVSSLGRAGEPNNSVCAAMPILTNQNLYFLADDANDWYRFTLDAPAQVKVKMSNYLADGQIVVFTGNCVSPTFIANNGNYETVKEIDLGERGVGTYYIWVLSDKDFNTISPYLLRVETTAP